MSPQSDELPATCPYCGNDHIDGQCRECGDDYCDECLSADGLCPNCDGRAAEDTRNP